MTQDEKILQDYLQSLIDKKQINYGIYGGLDTKHGFSKKESLLYGSEPRKMTLSQIAKKHQEGIGVPQRNFLDFYSNARNNLEKVVFRASEELLKNPESFFGVIATSIPQILKAQMRDEANSLWKPLSRRWAKRKEKLGFTRMLYNSGRMEQAITSEVI